MSAWVTKEAEEKNQREKVAVKMMVDSTMAIGFQTSIAPSVLSAGRNMTVLCYGIEDFGWSQLSGQIGWKKLSYEGNWSTIGRSKNRIDRGAISSGCWNPLSVPSDCHLFSARKKVLQTKVQVAADYSDSKSDPLECHGELGYHPLEEIQDCEKTEKGELTLTDAEIARTIVEVNNNATLMFSGTVDDELHENIFWPELQYVTDEYGDIYFEVNDDEDILRILSTSNSSVHVLIGLDDIQRFTEQETTLPENSNDSDIEDISDSDSDTEVDYEEDWISILEEVEELDLSESLGDWANLETMRSTHPMYFSKKLAEVVSTDYAENMDRPSKGLAILGLIRPAFMEEQSYVRKFLCEEEFSSTDIIDLSGSNKDGQLEEFIINKYNDTETDPLTSPKDDAVWGHGSENDEGSEIDTSLYKLEILNIQLVSLYGNQSAVSLQDFQQAEPDILAHSATTIIARINAGGKKTENALKSLCRKKKGIQVEEATLIGVDSLGVDLRVRSGTQVQTLRFAFSCRV
eukprot:Gb_25444 [translate_table: standard]